MMFEVLYPLLDMFYPFYKKENLNYQSELEQNKINYKKVRREINENVNNIIQKTKDRKQRRLIRRELKQELNQLKRRYKESKSEAKINFMSEVAKTKERKENVKLTRKSKSNLHQILYQYSKLPYEKKKDSLVVLEISPSREIDFSIKNRVFKDLNAFNDKLDNRVYATEKDIIFTNIKLENGNEKVPIVIKYTGQCVPIFLEKIRDDNMNKFSTENEHHIMLLSERLREIKAPNKFNMKLGKTGTMILIMTVIMVFYLGYKYFKGGA